MNKRIFFLLSLLLSSSALAYTIPKGSPYLGFAIGDQNSRSYNGLYANVFGGYSLLAGSKQNLFLAGELFVDTGSLPLSHKHHHRTTYGVGASILPGILVRPETLVYTRLGIASFRYNKHNNWRTGGQLGIGLQTSLSDHWDIRGEYVYTGKGIIHNFGINRFNFFDLGLLYKFK